MAQFCYCLCLWKLKRKQPQYVINQHRIQVSFCYPHISFYRMIVNVYILLLIEIQVIFTFFILIFPTTSSCSIPSACSILLSLTQSHCMPSCTNCTINNIKLSNSNQLLLLGTTCLLRIFLSELELQVSYGNIMEYRKLEGK